MKINKNNCLILLLVMLHVAVAMPLILSNDRISTIDAPNHAMFCVQLYREFIGVSNNDQLSLWEKITEFKSVFSKGIIYWPKFVYLISLPFLVLFGTLLSSVKLANLVFLVLLTLFLYLLSLKLGATRTEAVVISAVMPFYPVVLGHIQSYGLDFPLTAVIVAFIFVMLKTDGFKNTFYSIIAGVILGIGFLIKGQVLIFVFTPVIVYILSSIIDWRRKKSSLIGLFNIFANLAVMLFFAFQVGAIWWRGKYDEILSAMREHTTSGRKYLESHPHEEFKSLGFYLFYFKYLFYDGIGPVLSIISIVPFLRYFLRFKDKNKIIAIAWLVPPLLLFSFVFKVHQLRFILPVMPVVAIATVMGMRSKARLPGIIFKVLFSVFLLLQIYLLLFSKELSLVHKKVLASSSREYLVKTEQNSNLKIVTNFYGALREYLNPGDYKIIIVRFIPIEDGPVGLQFWLESEGYKHGYNVFTHDLFDQWLSVDRWLEEKGNYIVLFLLDIDRDLAEHDLGTLSLARIDEIWFLWHEELMQAKTTLEKILLRIDDSGHLFDFSWSSYYFKVYRYENF